MDDNNDNDNAAKTLEPFIIQNNDEGMNSNAYTKKKYPGFFENLRRYFPEYCGSTAIHGIQFIGERNRYLLENIVWVVIVTIAFCLCFQLVWQTYTKWMQSPVLITFSTTETPIWQVPFPAVTICPEVKSAKNRCDYEMLFTVKKFGSLDKEREKEFDYISLVCENPKTILHLNSSTMKTTDEAALDFLTKVAPDYSEVLQGCGWLSKEYDCDDLFTKILTSEGVCYTFNSIDRKELFTDDVQHYKEFWSSSRPSDWTVDQGYTRETELDVYPRRMLYGRASGGLEVVLKLDEQDVDIYCGESIAGFKLILHNPAELPNVEQQYFRIPLNTTVDLSFLTNIMSTAEELKHYDPSERECFFENERQLRFFKYYNQQNCMTECNLNNTLKECGCVDFHMPRDNSTPICGAGNYFCMRDAEEKYVKEEIRSEMIYIAKQKAAGRKKIPDKRELTCNCLPSCTFLDYEGKASQIAWDLTNKFGKVILTMFADAMENGEDLSASAADVDDDDNDTLSTVRFARVIIFPGQNQFITSERHELYATVDFWSSVGGLLGLFTGFSFISTIEIIHFLTLRLWCNIRRYGKHYWSGAPDLLQQRDNSTPICGAGNYFCMRDAEEKYVKEEIRSEMIYISKQKAAGRKKIPDVRGLACDCLPSCTQLQYEGKASQIAWDLTNKMGKVMLSMFADALENAADLADLVAADDDDNNTISTVRFARVIIFPAQNQFITSERHELYATVDFWSNVGGLLGLFTGFSFISTIEIIHFFTLRLWCNIRRYGKHYWSAAPDLLQQRSVED